MKPDNKVLSSRIIEDIEVVIEQESPDAFSVYQIFHADDSTDDVTTFDTEEQAFMFFDDLVELTVVDAGLSSEDNEY